MPVLHGGLQVCWQLCACNCLAAQQVSPSRLPGLKCQLVPVAAWRATMHGGMPAGSVQQAPWSAARVSSYCHLRKMVRSACLCRAPHSQPSHFPPPDELEIDTATASALATTATQLRTRLTEHLAERLGKSSTIFPALKHDSTVGGITTRRVGARLLGAQLWAGRGARAATAVCFLETGSDWPCLLDTWQRLAMLAGQTGCCMLPVLCGCDE